MPISLDKSFLIVLISSFLLSCCVNCQSKEDLVDLKNITMFPQNYTHDIYAGFLNITPFAKSLYYIFFQSQNDPINDPVVLWLNGGPGCSSLIGMATENGPFLFKAGTTQMYLNDYSFNKKANVIYLQSPSGVGFSYASKQNLITNDTQTAKDNLNAIRFFFEKFPIYMPNSFYIAGQSYAGIYIPMLADQILNFNEGATEARINLMGFMLGNACTHPLQCYTPTYQSRFFTQFLYTRGFLDETQYNQYQSECIKDQMSKTCIAIQKQLNENFVATGANIYNIYGYCYHPIYPPKFQKLLSEQSITRFEQKSKGLKHPLRCSDAIGSLTLFNSNQFRFALNVNQLNDTLPWTPCSDYIQYTVEPLATYYTLPKLVKAGLKIIYYSGDNDAIVPIQGTLYWFQKYRADFGAPIKKSWRPWVAPGQTTSGMLWQIEGLTFASVIGAGHMVPSDKPIQAYQIFNILLGYSDWKIQDEFQE